MSSSSRPATLQRSIEVRGGFGACAGELFEFFDEPVHGLGVA